jgi:hypothetical protein
MLEFKSSANHPKTPPAEWLLARVAGPDLCAARAAAIYGDLLEISATRGRLWFWTSYIRTLVTLGWRAPVAFLLALASVRSMCLIYPMWVQYELRHLTSERQVGMFLGQLAVVSGPLLNAIAMCLWFALPYVWMRFGLRDRLTQFACVLFLCTLPVPSLRVWLIDVSSIITLLVLVAALFSSLWRRPLIVLALTFATAIAAIITCFRVLAMNEHQAFHSFSPARGIGWLAVSFALALAAVVCSLLHQRLLYSSSRRRGVYAESRTHRMAPRLFRGTRPCLCGPR